MDSGMFIFNRDNTMIDEKATKKGRGKRGRGKKFVDEHHQQRIDLYTERYSLGIDLFTGGSLSEEDNKEREEVELLKTKCDDGKAVKGIWVGKARG
jgi:hypothetical protein